MVGTILETMRVAARGLRRTPSVAVLATLAFALGIGGTVTVFSAVNAAFLRALPYPDAGRLSAIWQSSPRSSEIAVPYPIVIDWATNLAEVDALAGYIGPSSLNVIADVAEADASALRTAIERVPAGSSSSGSGGARVTQIARVTEGFFRTLGVDPVLGRAFSRDDTRIGAPTAAIISHDLWQQLFAGDARVLSRALSIEGAAVPIIGVMPHGILFPEATHVWVSLDVDAADNLSRTAHNLRVITRRRPGVSDDALRVALTHLNERLQQTYPEQKQGLGVRVVPLRTQLLGQSASVLWLLFGSVALVLVIACANVANLLIARATGREVESALRRALGANGWALVTPIVAEALLVALAGATAGVALAWWGQRVLTAVVPGTVVDPADIRIDVTVLGFALLVTTITGLVSSVLPALTATHTELRHVLASGSRSLAGGSHRAMRTFVGVQIAFTCVLLTSAALFARSLAHLEKVDTGFRTDGVVYGSFAIGTTPGSAYTDPSARAAFYRSLIARVDTLPGVRMSGVVSDLPFGYNPNAGFDEDGVAEDRTASLHFRLVGGRYFETLGIPLRDGRFIDDRDRIDRPFVALINERAARMYWRGRTAIRQRIRMPGMDFNASWYTIVGIVADIRHRGLTVDPVPEAYFPFEQRPERTWGMQFVASVAGAPSSYNEAIRAAVSAIDPRIPSSMQPLTQLVNQQVQPTRFRAALVAAFGVTAVVLSMVGIFGVMSYVVARRTKEVGVRMALGADRRSVQRLVVMRALTPVLVGLVAGCAITLAVGRFAESLLAGISPRDPVALAAAVAALAISAVAAAWWPAWRASRLDPMVALRDE